MQNINKLFLVLLLSLINSTSLLIATDDGDDSGSGNSSDMEVGYESNTSGAGAASPVMSAAERQTRRYTAGAYAAVPDVYLHVPGAGRVFSITQFLGNPEERRALNRAYTNFVTTAQSLQNRAMWRAENHVVAELQLPPAPVYRVASPAVIMLPLSPLSPSWLAELPENFHELFQDEPEVPVVPVAVAPVVRSKRSANGQVGHVGQIRALQQADDSEEHKSESSSSGSGGSSKRPRLIE